jgi:hypothetical protein
MAKKPAAKPETKAKGKTQAAAPEVRENRYLRAARVIIETGEGVDLAELAMRAEMSEAAARYCLESFLGVSEALRSAKLLPAKATPEKAPVAPQGEREPEPATA